MRMLSFLAARGGLAAMLMIALAGPAPGLVGMPDARSDIAVVWDDHGSGPGQSSEHDVVDRSCYPDPSCSAAATPMTRDMGCACWEMQMMMREGMMTASNLNHEKMIEGGMHFRELRDGRPVGPMRDTLLVTAQDTREIGFVVDNPGDWLFTATCSAMRKAG